MNLLVLVIVYRGIQWIRVFMDPVVVQCVQRGDDHQRDERPHHFFGSGTDNRPDAVDKGDKGHQ